ncbi:hypothetical protein BSU04_20515 [Caballeronia sordidicola]|uniref:Uncharacterized protein n=1 Tax=Caballeronia sordidicola TaxID=196367 RepID=A0A226X061_CABSO|nr:hypothetical protein BSU04_20515 [Caballeronia sordidicola]
MLQYIHNPECIETATLDSPPGIVTLLGQLRSYVGVDVAVVAPALLAAV